MTDSKLIGTILQALEDMKAIDVVSTNVQGVVSFTDYMVIASGSSSRHVRALANNVAEEAKKIGYKSLGMEGYEYNEWILLDLGDAVVHLMLPEQREYYELEKLWIDHDAATASK